MLGKVQLERPVVESSRPRLFRLRHCIRRPRRLTDDWQVCSLRTVQGQQPMELRD